MSARDVDLDELDRRLLRGVHRTRWAAVGVLAVVLLVAIGVFAWVAVQQQERLNATCGFFKELGTISVTPAPGAPPTSKLGIQLVLNSRASYIGLGCSPALAPASPELRMYAKRYELNLPG